MNGEVYHFSGYRLDAERRELTAAGREIELQPRVFALLLYLVRNRDRAVDKDELIETLWPGMVVTETALTRAVMKARKAVGDDPGTQGVIKTLHGHGYRFVADLVTVADEPLEQAMDHAGDAGPGATQAGPAPSRLRPLRRIAVIALLVLLAVAVYKGGWRRDTGSPADEAPRVAVLPVVDATGQADMAWVPLGLMSYVSGLLAEEGAIQTVADGSMLTLAETLGADGVPDAGVAAGLMTRLAGLYGATHLLVMELRADRGRLRMNFTLWDRAGHARHGTMVGGEGPELAMGVVQSVYGQLLRRSRLAPGTETVSADPFNNEAFARGMAHSLEGRCGDAERYFRVILEQEPELFAPRHELAACLRILGKPEEAESILVALVREQRDLGADRQWAQAAMTLGVLYNRTGRLDEARASHEEALAAAERAGDHEQMGRVLNNLAIVAKDQGDPDQAHELLARAILEYRQGGREILPGQVYSLQANLAMAQGRLAEADTYLAQALDAFRAAGDRRFQAMMLNNTGYLRNLQGRLQEAETYHLEALAIRDEIGDRVGVGRSQNMLAVVYSEQGKYAEARDAVLAGLEVTRESRDRLFEATLQAQLGDAERGLGRPEEARVAFEEARRILIEIEDRSRALEVDLKLAALDLDEGQADNALETVRVVLDSAVTNGFLGPELEAMEMLGDIAFVRGDVSRAETAYRQALDRVMETSWQGREIRLIRKLAGLAMDRADLLTAEPLVGRLAGLEADSASLLAQARYAYLSGDPRSAERLAVQARMLAGDAWTEQDANALATYQGAAGSAPLPDH